MEVLTRRDVLKAAAAGSVALGSSGVLAACGSTSSKTSSTTAGGSPRRGGTLRIGLTGGSGTDTIDALSPVEQLDVARVLNLYDSLVTMTPQGTPELLLAEEITPNTAATEWTIRLKQGVVFHNGKELTADDLIYTLQATVNPKSPGAGAPLYTSVDVPGLKKLDKYTVQLPCKVPFAGLLDVLAAPAYGNIIPVGYNPKAPVGTGPFKLGRFTPGVQSSFVRNPNYWQTGLPYVDELVITDFADDTSMLNALLGGQVDAVSLLSSDVLAQVTGAGKSVLISEGSGFNPFVMNTKASPFTDVRVRQAMRLIVDRNQMREIVFGGHGSIGNDVFGLAAPEYDSALPQRTQDIEQAKSLLKAAGHAGLAIELVTADVGQGVVESAQVFAQQAKAAGVSVSIRMITTTEYFGSNFLKWQFTQDFWYYYLYLPQVAFTTLSTATYNETNFSDPRYDAMYRAAQSTIDTQQRYAIEHEMMMIDYTQGGYIIPTFVPVIDGYSPTVHGIQQSRTGVPLNEFNFKRVWID